MICQFEIWRKRQLARSPVSHFLQQKLRSADYNRICISARVCVVVCLSKTTEIASNYTNFLIRVKLFSSLSVLEFNVGYSFVKELYFKLSTYPQS